jgi:uncharacterized protein (DUF488 family)
MSSLVTVGYEGRSVLEVVDLLDAAGVSVLVDVRLTPLSRKPGLSKRGLAQQLADAGIEYMHLRSLGNPKDNRDGFRRGEPASWQRFRAVLSGDEGRDGLDQVRQLMRIGHTVALLCFEHDHDSCHRSLIVEELARTEPSPQVRAL